MYEYVGSVSTAHHEAGGMHLHVDGEGLVLPGGSESLHDLGQHVELQRHHQARLGGQVGQGEAGYRPIPLQLYLLCG